MENRQLRTEFKIGIVAFAISLLLRQFTAVPHFVIGALLGFAICFEVIGILPEAGYQRIKRFKAKLFGRTQ